MKLDIADTHLISSFELLILSMKARGLITQDTVRKINDVLKEGVKETRK